MKRILLESRDAAELAGLSTRAVKDAAARGSLEVHALTARGSSIFHPRDVRRWLRRRERLGRRRAKGATR